MNFEVFKQYWDEFQPDAPFVELVNYQANFSKKIGKKGTHLTKFSVLYIIFDKNKMPVNSYNVYVGETNDIVQRTQEHLNDTKREDFKKLNSSEHSRMFIIASSIFNKSMTMDLENEMMLYLSSVQSVYKIKNRRDNPQHNYFTMSKAGDLFVKTWNELRRLADKEGINLFPKMTEVRQSAIFSSSPFHKLNNEQENAKNLILTKIKKCLASPKRQNQLILVNGDAGSGKTVLLSTIFYLIRRMGETEKPINQRLIVNHDEQLKVYKEIARKLSIGTNKDPFVEKPTHFINRFSEKKW